MKDYRLPDDTDTYRIVGHIDQALARWYHYIAPEVQSIRGIPDDERAYSAMVFAIVSPRCHFGKNVAVTPPLVSAMKDGANRQELERILRRHGVGLAPTKSQRLHDIAPVLERFSPDRALLMALRGVGPKVASMALALYDDRLPVITLDTHMMRGLTGTSPDKIRWDHYRHIERFVLDCIGDPRRQVAPYATPFAVQWALWCDYSGKGFVSHLPLFGRDGN